MTSQPSQDQDLSEDLDTRVYEYNSSISNNTKANALYRSLGKKAYQRTKAPQPRNRLRTLLPPFNTLSPTPILSSPIKIQPPTPHEQKHKITHNKGGENAQIPPSVAIRKAYRLIKLISNFESTILAHICCVVCYVARATSGEEGAHVGATVLARR